MAHLRNKSEISLLNNSHLGGATPTAKSGTRSECMSGGRGIEFKVDPGNQTENC